MKREKPKPKVERDPVLEFVRAARVTWTSFLEAALLRTDRWLHKTMAERNVKVPHTAKHG